MSADPAENPPLQTISTAAFLYSPTVRHEYAARHPASPEPTVRANDFAFGLHATILCIIIVSQFWSKLWGWTPLAQTPRPTKITLAVLCCSCVIVLVSIFIVLADQVKPVERRRGWGWIDVVCICSLSKNPRTGVGMVS
jgi:cystinosin